MPNLHRQYTQELHDELGNYWATWLPGVLLDLGTVGTMEDGIFVPRTHLNAFGITFGIRKDPKGDDKFQYQSSGGVELAFKARGKSNNAFEYLASADAGMRAAFRRENAILFSLRGCYENRIDDQSDLARKLLELPKTHFPQNYVIITHLVSAASGTILISSSGQSCIELSARAAIKGLADLAKVDAGLSIRYMRDMHTQIVASAGLTPLFRAVQIRKPWFGPRRVEAFGQITFDEVVEEVNYAGES